jgi:hypothetical protein
MIRAFKNLSLMSSSIRNEVQEDLYKVLDECDEADFSYEDMESDKEFVVNKLDDTLDDVSSELN